MDSLGEWTEAYLNAAEPLERQHHLQTLYQLLKSPAPSQNKEDHNALESAISTDIAASLIRFYSGPEKKEIERILRGRLNLESAEIFKEVHKFILRWLINDRLYPPETLVQAKDLEQFIKQEFGYDDPPTGKIILQSILIGAVLWGAGQGASSIAAYQGVLANAVGHISALVHSLSILNLFNVSTFVMMLAGVVVANLFIPDNQFPSIDSLNTSDDILEATETVMDSHAFKTLVAINHTNHHEFNREKYARRGRQDNDRFFMNFGYNGFFSPYIYATLIERMKESILTGLPTRALAPLQILDIGSGSAYVPFLLSAMGKSIDTLDINSHLIGTQQAALNANTSVTPGNAYHGSIFEPTGRLYDLVTGVNTVNLHTPIDPWIQDPRDYVDPSDFDPTDYALHVLDGLFGLWDWTVPGGLVMQIIAGKFSYLNNEIELLTGFRVVEEPHFDREGHPKGFTTFVLQRPTDRRRPQHYPSTLLLSKSNRSA